MKIGFILVRGSSFTKISSTRKTTFGNTQLKKIRQDTEETKCEVERIYKGEQTDNYSRLIDQISNSKFPIFECISSQNLPIENSLLPLFKRKLMNHTIQKTKTLQLNA